MSIELVMPSSHLILCHPLLLLPPIPPSIRVFSNAPPPHSRRGVQKEGSLGDDLLPLGSAEPEQQEGASAGAPSPTLELASRSPSGGAETRSRAEMLLAVPETDSDKTCWPSTGSLASQRHPGKFPKVPALK